MHGGYNGGTLGYTTEAWNDKLDTIWSHGLHGCAQMKATRPQIHNKCAIWDRASVESFLPTQDKTAN